MICVDNSEWMRNSDFAPTRLEAQRDAIQLISGRKLNGHPESCVALMTMSGRTEVLATLTNDVGKIFAHLHKVRIDGSIDFVSTLKIAKLALKFRQQKNHRQRIIVFVGSPINASDTELKQLGKKLQKDNISVDVINFGEEETNQEKLDVFIKAVDKNEGSHLVTVPSGVRVLSDVLIKSPILSSGESNDTGGGGGGDDFVDPNMDPELALALRVSMEEERERQRQAQLASQGEGNATEAEKSEPMDMADDMNDELRAAMQMSMNEMQDNSTANAPPAQEEKSLDQMTEEEQIAWAIKMSTMESEASDKMDTAEKEAEPKKDEVDADFLKEVISGIPGVDMDDEELKKAMESAQKQEDKTGDK